MENWHWKKRKRTKTTKNKQNKNRTTLNGHISETRRNLVKSSIFRKSSFFIQLFFSKQCYFLCALSTWVHSRRLCSLPHQTMLLVTLLISQKKFQLCSFCVFFFFRNKVKLSTNCNFLPLCKTNVFTKPIQLFLRGKNDNSRNFIQS